MLLEKLIKTIPIVKKKTLIVAKSTIVEFKVGTGYHAFIICCLKA
jgi:hypothetical protein